MKRLVLIHGWAFTGAIFSDLVAHLREQFEVQVIDLPGYGECYAEHFPDTLEEVAAEIARQIEKESILIGWSLGGLIAQQIALDFPEKVEHLIMIAVTPCFVKKKGWDNAADPVLTRRFYKQLQEESESAVSAFHIQLTAMEQRPRKMQQEIESLQGKIKVEKEDLLQSFNILRKTDFRDQLSRITKKIVWIYGENDQLVLKPAVPLTSDSEVQIIAGAGHIPFISQQEQCLHLIKEAAK